MRSKTVNKASMGSTVSTLLADIMASQGQESPALAAKQVRLLETLRAIQGQSVKPPELVEKDAHDLQRQNPATRSRT